MQYSQDTADICIFIKNLHLTSKNHAVSGTCAINSFDVLTSFVNEANILGIWEAQKIFAIYGFLLS